MEKVWVKNYPKGIPAEADVNAYTSIGALFSEICENYPEQVAYYHQGVRLTYQEVYRLSCQFAAYLHSLGLRKGDRIALMMPNILQYPVALFGALLCGLVVVNVNPLYKVDELVHEINDAKPSAIVVFAHFAHTLEKSLSQITNLKIIVTEFGDLFPLLKRRVTNFVVKHIMRMVPKYTLNGSVRFLACLSQGAQYTFKPELVAQNDLAFLQYTGGTTGVAKGAMLSHGNMIANVMQASAWFEAKIDMGKEILIAALPIYHIFTLLANCLLFMRFASANILITNPRDLKNMVKEISKYPFTGMTGVNILFNALLNDKTFCDLDFSQFKLALGGGAAVQEAVAKRWQQVTGKPLYEAYGLTEASPGVLVSPYVEGYQFDGSAGLPLPSTEIKLIDEDNNEVGFNTPGELCVKGPQVMQGYWQRPDETAKVLSEDGWLRTGDIAEIDEKGFVRIVDRKKDMIIVSGFNVFPNEVEDVIAKLPEVREVAVIGLPEAEHGEIVAAYIVKKVQSLTKDQVIGFCRAHMTGYKIPRMVEFVDELPKSNVGKILRRELKAQVRSGNHSIKNDR